MLVTAAHVAFDSITTERLVQLGATNVVRASDNLLLGPSRRDPQKHATVRRAWWGAEEEWDRLYSPDVRWAAPIAIWTSTHIAERVNLWRACSWLRHLGIKAKDVWFMELAAVSPSRTPEEPLPPLEWLASVADHSDDALLEHLAKARRWPSSRHNKAVELWTRYTDADPSRLVDSCLHGVRGFPELGPLWAFLSQLFPRRAGKDLHLSRFDELLLFILSEEWQTAVDVFVQKSQPGVELRRLGSCTGDLFIPQRLDDWVAVGAVERAAGPKPPDCPMLSSVYRITEKGIRMREKGLDRLADAPTLPIGGTEAYGAPWVLLEEGRLARGT